MISDNELPRSQLWAPHLWAEGSALWGQLGAPLDLEDPCSAFSVVLLFAVFSCLIDNNLGLILSSHFDANLSVFLSFEATQTE